jgi:Na+-driven multidrug efflux pump
LPVVFFFTLPLLLDVNGIWLAVAAGDITTTVVIVILLIVDKVRKNG